MQRVLFAIATLIAAMLVGSPVGAAEPVEPGPGPGAQAELTRVYAQILRDPTNSQLNLRYAELAEASGKLRWALAAYDILEQQTRILSWFSGPIFVASSRFVHGFC